VTLLLSHVFLGEAVRGVEVASCVCCLAGVLVISLSPGSAESLPAGHPVVHRPSGILFAVLCALLQATAYVVTRWMGSRVHSQWNVLSLGFASLLLGLGLLNRSLPAEAQRALSSRSHLLIIAGAGIGSYLGASGVNRALQLLSAGTISVLRSADIPISLALGFAFLGERLSSWYSLAGTVSITLASLTLGHSRATRA
jgi:drug/metabolite transporter (DMT)-like permease